MAVKIHTVVIRLAQYGLKEGYPDDGDSTFF
jgi:hypothetical protein